MNESEYMAVKDPLKLLSIWVDDAKKAVTTENYNSMVVSSCDNNQQPSSRIVLLKEVTPEGLIFYTNYLSQKGQDFASNPKVAVNFHWDILKRQICIQGQIEKVSPNISDDYWHSRPKASQISQYISKQSQPVDGRKKLEDLCQQAIEDFGQKDIPKPPYWGGYLIKPQKVEFWIAHDDRLHDRFLYSKKADSWLAQRLFP